MDNTQATSDSRIYPGDSRRHLYVEALIAIARGDERPGHVAYKSKRDMTEIARNALIAVDGIDPWHDV